MGDPARATRNVSRLRLWWLQLRGSLNWRWALATAALLLVLGWLIATAPTGETCSRARARLSEAQRALIAGRDRPAEDLVDVRATATTASNEVLAYCGQPQLPERELAFSTDTTLAELFP